MSHYARPREVAAGSRHVELFGLIPGWDARIIAGDRGLRGSAWHGKEGAVETVRTLPFEASGLGRVLNWISYAVMAFFRGVRTRPLHLVYGSSPHLLAALTGWAISRVRRVPFVLEVRDVWPRVLADMGVLDTASPVYRVLVAVERHLYRRADRVVYLAEGVVDHLAACGVPVELTLFVPNGANSSDFIPTRTREALRAWLDVSGVVAVYAGAHGPANGLDGLLDAASRLEAVMPELTFLLIGDGGDKPRLEARAARERMANVRFHEPVAKNLVPDILGACDIGVHCLADVALFRDSVSPNKLFDYMAAGLPVITNTPGVTAAYVEASGGGIAVPPDGLAAGLARLTKMSEEDRRALGRAARAHLDATRSRTVMALRLGGLLDQVAPVGRVGRTAPR